MLRVSTFTPRMWLILVHDLLATAAAVVASFFIRFEEGEVALHLAARSLQHRARRHGAGAYSACARLRTVGAERLRHFLFRQNHHRALLASADCIPVRPAHCLPLLSLHPHPAP